MWTQEHIPDDALLFRRVHQNYVQNDDIPPAAFREVDDSVDWSKYSTAEEALLRAKEPEKNGIVALQAGKARAIEGVFVEHDPVDENHVLRGLAPNPNQAHSIVRGEKTTERRLLLKRACAWVIRVIPRA